MLTATANMPRCGDSLVVCAVSELPLYAVNCNMDLSGVHIGRRSEFVHKACNDTMTTTAFGTVARFLLSGDTLVLSGYENRRMLVEYDTPPPILRWPFMPGDSVGGPFEGRAAWCSRMYARIKGNAWSVADRLSSLVLPSGDTITNVIRLRHVRETHHITYDSINNWGMLRRTAMQDASSIFSKCQPVRTETTALFAIGWRYPILVAEVTQDMGGRRVSAILCTPTEQARQNYDMDNALRRDTLVHEVGENAILRNASPPVHIISIRYDDMVDMLHVSCEAAADTEVTLRIADSSGILWRESTDMVPAGLSNTLHVDCSGLRHGQYALLVTCGAERQSFKFSIR